MVKSLAKNLMALLVLQAGQANQAAVTLVTLALAHQVALEAPVLRLTLSFAENKPFSFFRSIAYQHGPVPLTTTHYNPGPVF